MFESNRAPKCLPLLVALSFSTAFGQSSVINHRGKDTSQTAAQITRFFIAEPATGSKYEAGPLHIIYGDGTDIVEALPPRRFNSAVGIAGAALAEDRQALGWEINADAYGQSYSIPVGVTVLRHRKVLQVFHPPMMIWDWMFIESGKQMAILAGPVHGSEGGDYTLYDVETGELVSEVSAEVGGSLKPEAPEWAKQLLNHFDK